LLTLRSLDAYLTRIGLDHPASLFELHRSHATSVPFENFDSSAGRAVSLDPAQLEDKLVARRRGGYCFEHNLLFMAALHAINIDVVEPMLARVRNNASDGPGPLNHLVLRAVDRGDPWLVDVGFGGGGLLDPIPFSVGAEADQSGWRYRLIEEGAEIVLQVHQDGDWMPLYGFVPEPVPMVDIEVANWYTSTHPSSPFVSGVIAGARRVDRCLTFYQFDEPTLVERAIGAPPVTTTVSRSDVPALLEQRFGIAGVIEGARGRPVIGGEPGV
jgi:N-hydroxyarylamine O-acetyltransferase